MADQAGSPKQPVATFDNVKATTTSDKKLQVEFSVSELAKKLGPALGSDLASCGGCNGCMGCSHIVD